MEQGEKPKNLGGRPEFVPTDEQRALVERLTGLLVPQKEIARDWFPPNGISPMTLKKHFKRELAYGREKTASSLKARILRAAENGSLRAMTYLTDRLCPEFAPKFRLTGADDDTPLAIGGSQTTIVIRGGLPPAEEAPAVEREGPRPNGAHKGNGADPPV
jgi:hypothetical protein